MPTAVSGGPHAAKHLIFFFFADEETEVQDSKITGLTAHSHRKARSNPLSPQTHGFYITPNCQAHVCRF